MRRHGTSSPRRHSGARPQASSPESRSCFALTHIEIPGSRIACAPRNDSSGRSTISLFTSQAAPDTRPHSRSADRARALPSIALELREGAGKAGYRLIPMVRVQQKSTRQNHRFSQITGLPCATVLTLIRALLRDRLSCPCCLRARRFIDLASAPGCQDHTISRPHQLVRPRDHHAAS